MDTGLIGRDLESFIPDEDASESVLHSVAHVAMDNLLGGKAGDIRTTWLTSDQGPWSNRGFRLNAKRVPAIVRLDDGHKEYEVRFEDRSIDDCLWVERISDGLAVTDEGVTRVFQLAREEGTAGAAAHSGAILAPMPGRILAVQVAEGEAVTKGQKLLTLEAMKMEHTLIAPFDGTVSRLAAKEGDQVQLEAVLAEIEPSGEGDA